MIPMEMQASKEKYAMNGCRVVSRSILKKNVLFWLYGFLSLFSCCNAQIVIPLVISQQTMPHCEITIENQAFLAGIDLGAAGSQFDSDVIPNEYATPLASEAKLASFSKGKKEVLREWKIQPIKLGTYAMPPLIAVAKEENPYVYTFSDKDNSTKQVDIVEGKDPPIILGNPVFRNFSVLIDFPNSSLTLFEPNESYDNVIENWIEVDFSWQAGLIAFPLEQEGKIKNFFIDTGMSRNFLATKNGSCQEQFCIRRLEIHSIKLGTQEVQTGCFYQMDRELAPNMDGVLGISFFNTRPILIDFPHKKIFFPNKK